MPKGRVFAPNYARDGIWYHHHGSNQDWPPRRSMDTTTGRLLENPYSEDRQQYPPQPPDRFSTRQAPNYKLQNVFSEHDNRFNIETFGESFGNGLDTRKVGKSMVFADFERPHALHHSDHNFLEHACQMQDAEDTPMSIYTDSYRPRPATDMTSFRRFPRLYPKPDPQAGMGTSTSLQFVDEYGEVNYKTRNQVLLDSGEPHLRHNTWKYSYKGNTTPYPDMPHVRRDLCTSTVSGERSARPNRYIRMLQEEIPTHRSRGVMFVTKQEEHDEQQGTLCIPYCKAKFTKHRRNHDGLPRVEIIESPKEPEPSADEAEEKPLEDTPSPRKSKKHTKAIAITMTEKKDITQKTTAKENKRKR